MSKPIQIFSEIEPLKRVMLHRPGAELENLMPDYLEDLLFDDIPFLAQAQQEHDFFAKVLVENGCEVVYLEDLAAETLQLSGCKEAFLDDYLQETKIQDQDVLNEVRDYFLSIKDERAFIDQTMAGLKKQDLSISKTASFSAMRENDYPFIIDPMPNLYFTRDPFAIIGHSISLNRMFPKLVEEKRFMDSTFSSTIRSSPSHRSISCMIEKNLHVSKVGISLFCPSMY